MTEPVRLIRETRKSTVRNRRRRHSIRQHKRAAKTARRVADNPSLRVVKRKNANITGVKNTRAKETKADFAGEMNAKDAATSPAMGTDQTNSVEGATKAMGESAQKPMTVRVSSTSTEAAALAQPMTKDEETENVKELLKQAQVVLKKGGGNIEMLMKPEGIGSVKLKVSMDNGQLNVQMITENETAKKMLEKGLGELKSSLAEHQLKVDNIKVDVGSEIKKHMDQNADSGHSQSREQARQFASDFMGQFRDERQGFRQGLMENPGMRRSYGGGSKPDMTPAPVKASNNDSSSRRLNVVA